MKFCFKLGTAVTETYKMLGTLCKWSCISYACLWMTWISREWHESLEDIHGCGWQSAAQNLEQVVEIWALVARGCQVTHRGSSLHYPVDDSLDFSGRLGERSPQSLFHAVSWISKRAQNHTFSEDFNQACQTNPNVLIWVISEDKSGLLNFESKFTVSE